MVTQQPGSLPQELVSQGDNFFVFHLLSAADLSTLKRANAHFSDDLLSSLLNEPLVGHGIFWSSAPGTDQSARPYPLPIRVFDFSAGNSAADPSYDRDAIVCYAAQLKERYVAAVRTAAASLRRTDDVEIREEHETELAEEAGDDNLDAQALYRRAAIDGLSADERFVAQVMQRREAVEWGTIQYWLSEYAPEPPIVDDRFKWAFDVVIEALDDILGVGGYRRERRPGGG